MDLRHHREKNKRNGDGLAPHTYRGRTEQRVPHQMAQRRTGSATRRCRTEHATQFHGKAGGEEHQRNRFLEKMNLKHTYYNLESFVLDKLIKENEYRKCKLSKKRRYL